MSVDNDEDNDEDNEMTSAKSKLLALKVQQRPNNDGYFRLEASPVVINTSNRNDDCSLGELQGLSDISKHGEYNDLIVMALGRDGDEPREIFSVSIAFQDKYKIELTDAERMVKTLKKIDRHMSKLEQKYGRAEDYAATVARVAEAVGAEHMLFRSKVDNNGQSATGYTFRATDICDGVYAIRNLEREWCEGGK